MADKILNDPKFQLYLYGPDGSVSPRFTQEVMARLASEFTIPIEMVEGLGYVLETLSRSYWTQTNRPQISRIEVRKELAALVKAADKLRDVISATSPETWDVIVEAGLRQKWDTNPFPRFSEEVHEKSLQSVTKLHFQPKIQNGSVEFEFSEWAEAVEALSECSSSAHELAGGGKPGPQPDYAAFFLIHGAYAVWTAELKREFKILWADDGQWLTPAAQFCFEVARIVDPDIDASRIATGAKRAQEESKRDQ